MTKRYRKIEVWKPGTGQTWGTSGGKILRDEDIQKLADEAAAGYDVDELKVRRDRRAGRPMVTRADVSNALEEYQADLRYERALAAKRERRRRQWRRLRMKIFPGR